MAADGSYRLVGGFCNANTQVIGYNIGIYIFEYLINFQKFNLTVNFILFDMGLKTLTVFANFHNDEDHPLSIFFINMHWHPFFLCALVITFRPTTFLYRFLKCF